VRREYTTFFSARLAEGHYTVGVWLGTAPCFTFQRIVVVAQEAAEVESSSRLDFL